VKKRFKPRSSLDMKVELSKVICKALRNGPDKTNLTVSAVTDSTLGLSTSKKIESI
jgi:hypothetical protein